MARVEKAIRDFIANEILHGAGDEDLSADRPLLADGVLDSLGLQDLVTFLEKDLGVKLGDEHFTPENFESIATITELVKRVRGQ
jgi:acyl carrier protein